VVTRPASTVPNKKLTILPEASPAAWSYVIALAVEEPRPLPYRLFELARKTPRRQTP
jgi:hypothetical protein